MRATLHRLAALTVKESRQIRRDPSSIALAVLLPLLLLILFGYGMSMDVRNIKMTVVMPESSREALNIAARMQLSRYFRTSIVRTAREAEAVLYLPPDFSHKLNEGNVTLYLAVNGVNANQARLMSAYVENVIQLYLAKERNGAGLGPVTLAPRIWFNDANDSRYYLIPGVIVLIMTIIGAQLTALVMAREYERGTLESLFVSPVRSWEILLAKALNNFALAIIGLSLALLFARYVFGVPIRGTVFILLAVSALYLLVMLGVGLLISSVSKNQFIACQMSLFFTFMPAFMLSGFFYDIGNMPQAVQWVTYLVPARYYVTLMQTLFLAGDIWSVIVPNALILAVIAVLMLCLAWWKTPKRLE